ncbi:hypothetical protein K438DRAFT_1942990 [Mycena galopus ATCC 62051]|nr:hypothetical protein K438DRAFT_1942990 [Mycena galopus ATCC 62051]
MTASAHVRAVPNFWSRSNVRRLPRERPRQSRARNHSRVRGMVREMKDVSKHARFNWVPRMTSRLSREFKLNDCRQKVPRSTAALQPNPPRSALELALKPARLESSACQPGISRGAAAWSRKIGSRTRGPSPYLTRKSRSEEGSLLVFEKDSPPPAVNAVFKFNNEPHPCTREDAIADPLKADSLNSATSLEFPLSRVPKRNHALCQNCDKEK